MFLKQLILGPKKPQGPDPTLIKSTNRQAERAREADKRERETVAAQFRRALSSGRNLLISGFKGGSAGGPGGGGAGSAGARGSVSANLPGQQFSSSGSSTPVIRGDTTPTGGAPR